MLGKDTIFPFSSINYIFSMDYISLLNFTYVFAIITCLGFLVMANYAYMRKWLVRNWLNTELTRYPTASTYTASYHTTLSQADNLLCTDTMVLRLKWTSVAFEH